MVFIPCDIDIVSNVGTVWISIVCFRCPIYLSEVVITPRFNFGNRAWLFADRGPSLLRKTSVVSYRRWKIRLWTLGGVTAATLDRISVQAAWWSVILLVTSLQDVAVPGVWAIMGWLRGWMSPLAKASVRPHVPGLVLLSDGCANGNAAYILNVADTLYASVTLPGWWSWRQLGRRWRASATSDATTMHVLALAGQTSGIRWGRWWRFLVSWPQTEGSTQWSLKKFKSVIIYFNIHERPNMGRCKTKIIGTTRPRSGSVRLFITWQTFSNGQQTSYIVQQAQEWWRKPRYNVLYMNMLEGISLIRHKHWV